MRGGCERCKAQAGRDKSLSQAVKKKSSQLDNLKFMEGEQKQTQSAHVALRKYTNDFLERYLCTAEKKLKLATHTLRCDV